MAMDAFSNVQPDHIESQAASSMRILVRIWASESVKVNRFVLAIGATEDGHGAIVINGNGADVRQSVLQVRGYR